MNNRTVTITAVVVVAILAILGIVSYMTPGTPLYPGSGGASSSMSSLSSVMQTSSISSEETSSSSAMTSSSLPAQTSSAMTNNSSVSAGSSSSFAQNSPRETVSHFYLEWATYGGFINNELAATSPFLTERMRTSVTSGTEIFCNERQPLNFTTVLLSKGDSEATVQVNERYANGVTVSPIVTVVSQDETWRIDAVRCPDASSSSNSSI